MPSDAETSETPVVDRSAWTAARRDLMLREKQLTRQRDELSEQRRRLPRLEIDVDYSFAGPTGDRSLAGLFDDRSQLLVYHFMLGPGWVDGCPSCSFWADNFDGTEVHLANRDTTLVVVSSAPLDEITAYRERMGWGFQWYSSAGSNFNSDFGVSFTEQAIATGDNYNFGTQTFPGPEAPGISVFSRDEAGRVFLTYQTFSRGIDMVNGAYHLLDLTPNGRDEGSLDFSMAWLRRHDEY